MKVIGVAGEKWERFRTGVGRALVWVIAAGAVAAYLWVNVQPWNEVGLYVGGGCASVPVLLFGVACARNGLRFTLGWSAGLLALAFISFIAYGMDAGLWSFLLAGVLACLWMAALVFVALAYRPQEGALGTMWRGAVQGVQGARASMGKGATGVNIM